MTGHANLTRGHYQERTTLEHFSVFLYYSIELVDLSLQLSSGKPKEDNTGMDKSLVEDQLAEITVGDHQYPSLLPGSVSWKPCMRPSTS
jgi:hypothetical protein